MRSDKASINWSFTQKHSARILHSGITLLKESEEYLLTDISEKGCGNYLISNESIRYIGEAQNLKKRIKQQSTEVAGLRKCVCLLRDWN